MTANEAAFDQFTNALQDITSEMAALKKTVEDNNWNATYSAKREWESEEWDSAFISYFMIDD